MSTGASCPGCGASLFPAEIADGQCTSCMKRLPADFSSRAVTPDRPEPRRESRAASGPLRDDDYPGRHSYYGRLTTAEGWGGMRLGVTLVYWGVILNLISLGIQLLTIPLLFCGAFLLIPFLAVIGAGVTLVGGLLCLIGFILYCTIPEQSGGRGWAMAGLGCLLATIAAFVLLFLVAISDAFGARRSLVLPEAILFLWLMGILVLVFMTSLSFTLVMRAAARYWGDRTLAGSFVSYFVVSWVGAVALVLFVFCVGLSLRSSYFTRDVTVLINCGSLVVALVMTVWFLTLLSRLRDVIPSVPA